MVSARSGFQPTMPKACDTMRVPGFSSLEEARLQLVDEEGQQIHRDHARLRDVGGEHVALTNDDALGDLGAARVVARLLHQPAVELDADAARAELLRRRDHDAAVARAEVDHQVARRGAGELAACARPLRPAW